MEGVPPWLANAIEFEVIEGRVSRRAEGWPEAQAIVYARRSMAEPTVVEVLRLEEPDLRDGRRHVIVRWSDGTVGRALSYFPDEILVSEGDMLGKCAAELRALHFTRDREYLQRED